MQINMTRGKPQQASQGIFSFRRDFRSRSIQNTIQMRRIDEVIKPNVDLKRKELKLQPTQKSLLILDVFKCHAESRQGSITVSITEYRGCFPPCQHDSFFQPLDIRQSASWKSSSLRGIQQKYKSKWKQEGMMMISKLIRDYLFWRPCMPLGLSASITTWNSWGG